EPSSVEKNMETDEHIGCAMSGLIAKCTFSYGEPMTVESTTHALCDLAVRFGKGEEEPMNHRFSYGESMTVESTTHALCDLALQFGEGEEERMSRPFGVSLPMAQAMKKTVPVFGWNGAMNGIAFMLPSSHMRLWSGLCKVWSSHMLEVSIHRAYATVEIIFLLQP
nr:proteasome subunit alpha type-5 [Tanacetum cinerariifolium]